MTQEQSSFNSKEKKKKQTSGKTILWSTVNESHEISHPAPITEFVIKSISNYKYTHTGEVSEGAKSMTQPENGQA